ncbi:hypothetical protein EDD27_4525 [Nonomuraea polychroma]|uniref:Uncharacterized protein n=1 Tax=Nonomuraea polychroma TaxID=46176 RepID=A0A438M873_9ACTN|nr:hypothetical protein EDD27_4525 [Nonomuraea polychroma]
MAPGQVERSKAQVKPSAEQIWVHVDGAQARLPAAELVAARVGRLPENHPLDPRIAAA